MQWITNNKKVNVTLLVVYQWSVGSKHGYVYSLFNHFRIVSSKLTLLT